MDDNKKDKENKSVAGMPIGMSLGMCFGTAIGAATNNIGLWLPIGMTLGMCFGLCVGSLLNKSDKTKNGENSDSNEEVQ